MSYDVNSLESHWMPFTANRDFKKDPRIVVKVGWHVHVGL
jgi:beta-alanine--pyruvate transaminase